MKSFIFTLLVVFSVELSFAQNEIPSFISDSLDSFITNAIEEWDIPGLSIGIVAYGEPIMQKGYGVCEKGKQDKVDENTLFMIGSNTKAFVCTSLALLEQRGKCSMNDKVTKYLPSFTASNAFLTQNLNLTDIVSHRIGMETFQGDFMYWGSSLSSAQIVEKFGQLEPLYNFRTKWGYCNAGFVAAGEVIKSISGKPWTNFVEDNITKPLEMNRTVMTVSELKKMDNKTSGHTIINNEIQVIPYGEIDNLGAAASISSSAKEMINWLKFQMDTGYFNGKQIIPGKVIQKTHIPASIIGKGNHPINRNNFNLYGLGWSLEDYEGSLIVSHTGGINGYVTSVTVLPEEKIGIVILTNTDHNILYEALKWDIIDAFKGLPFRNYHKLYLNYHKHNEKVKAQKLKTLKDSIAQNNPTPVPLKNYEGTYIHQVYGDINIKAKKDKLYLSFEHHPKLTATLEHIKDSRFLCTYSDVLYGTKVFPFKLSGNKVESFVLSVSDFLEFTTYTFKKQ